MKNKFIALSIIAISISSPLLAALNGCRKCSYGSHHAQLITGPWIKSGRLIKKSDLPRNDHEFEYKLSNQKPQPIYKDVPDAIAHTETTVLLNGNQGVGIAMTTYQTGTKKVFDYDGYHYEFRRKHTCNCANCRHDLAEKRLKQTCGCLSWVAIICFCGNPYNE